MNPFKTFRKYQKVALAALGVMVMIAFGLGDVLRQMGGGGRGQGDSRVVFETNIGNLNEITIYNLSIQRKTLHRFIETAFFRSHPEYEKFRGHPQFGRFAQSIFEQVMERYGFGGVSEFEMLDKWLHLHEAEKLGIAVADDQIQKYIDQFTESKLSRDKFLEIVHDMQISPKQLYELFRVELEVQTARRLTLPVPLPSPEIYWQYFQQLNTRQKIAVAAIPVNSFTDKTGEPTDAEIAKLFNKVQYEGESAINGEFRPGFRQPQKVKLQYLEIAYSTVEEKVRTGSPVTEAEIEEYYEANKATAFWLQEPPAPPADERNRDDKTPIDPEITPEESGKEPANSEKGPQLEPSQEEGTNDSKPADNPEKPQAKDDAVEQDGTKKGDATEGDKQSECVAAFADDEANDETDVKPQVQDDAAEDKDSENKDPENKDRESKDVDASGASDKSDAPAKDDVKPKISPPPEPKFKPLDDELRDRIRETLITARIAKTMKDRADNARRAMGTVAESFANSKDIKLVDPDEKQLADLEQRSAAELRKIAEKLGMKYGETGLVSPLELSEIPGLGKAYDPESQISQDGRMTTILQQAFLNDGLCQPFDSETLSTSRYVWWKVRDVPAHVPELKDPGIREQVVAAWRRLAAQPLAQNRAEELAKQARSSGKEFETALADETVTGASVGQLLAVFESGVFSFWQESSVPNPRAFTRQVQLGNPSGIASPGRKFMQVVFEQLADGEIGVALNDDASIYYVVKVLDRRAPDREEFKDAKLFEGSAYSSIAQREFQFAMQEHNERVREKYAIRMKDLPQRRGRQAQSFDDE